MAQTPFPLDPVQTQLTRPTTNVTAPSVAGPQQTGLSQGLANLSTALGSAAKFAKARRFKEDMKNAGLAAAKGEIAPGLVSADAVEHNFKVLDENYVNDVLDKLKLHGSTHISHLANDGSKTSIQKADEIEGFLDTVMGQGLQTVTHNGEALGKLRLGIASFKRTWLQDVAQYEKQVLTQANIKKLHDNLKNKLETEYWTGDPEKNIFIEDHNSNIQSLKDAKLQPETARLNGKKVKATIDINVIKGNFQINIDTFLEHFERNPIQYGYLVTHMEDYVEKYIDPKIKTENVIITSGKGATIGDALTLQSMKDKLFERLAKILKAHEELSKNGWGQFKTDMLFRMVNKRSADNLNPSPEMNIVTDEYGDTSVALLDDPAHQRITQQTELTNSEKYEVFEMFPDTPEGRADARREITVLKKDLLNFKNDKDSKAYRTLRTLIYRRELTSIDDIKKYMTRRGIRIDLLEDFKTINTDVKNHMAFNVEKLQKRTPSVSFSRINKALANTVLLKHMKAEMSRFTLQEQLVMDYPVLEKLINTVSGLLHSKEFLKPIQEAQRILNLIADITDDRAEDILRLQYRPRIKETVDGKIIYKEDETKKTNTNREINREQLTAYEEEINSLYEVMIKQFELVEKKDETPTK